jgi:MFS-type transporter involved in bile tolerance (Atg22 family)
LLGFFISEIFEIFIKIDFKMKKEKIGLFYIICQNFLPVGKLMYGILFKKFDQHTSIIIILTSVLSVSMIFFSENIFYRDN